jgi:hypothetical protein
MSGIEYKVARALGRRAFAAVGGRWFPGTVYQIPPPAGYVGQMMRPTWGRVSDHEEGTPPISYWPDLRDPGTLGWFEAMLCEAWDDPNAHASYRPLQGPPGRPWCVALPRKGAEFSCDFEATRIEAVVTALETAVSMKGMQVQ